MASLLRFRLWLARRASWAVPCLVGAVGGLICVSWFSPFPYTVSALGFTVSVGIMDHGYTRLVVPPLGQVMARTHWSPLQLTVTLDNVDIDLLRDLAVAGELGREQLDEIIAGLQGTLRHFLLRTLVLAVVGGGLAAFVVGLRQPRPFLAAVAAATAVYGSLVLLTEATYDLDAFQQPRYTGVLQAAPWMVGLVEESILKVDELGERLAALAGNLVVLFERIDALDPLARPPAELLALVVSDIHNNPAAVDFIGQIVRSFEPHLVLDAGDITDFGTLFEAPLIEGITRLGIPYVLVPGNHEGPDIVARLAEAGNVHLITGGEISVHGLRIMGLADPSSTSSSPAIPGDEEIAQGIRRLEAMLAEGEEPPHVLLVHNPELAEPFAGRIPIIVSGHTHTIWLRQRGETVWLNPGTTGAAGIRGLQARQEVPYSLILAYLTRSPETGRWHVTATDTLRVFNFSTGFHIERRLFAGEEAAGQADEAGRQETGS